MRPMNDLPAPFWQWAGADLLLGVRAQPGARNTQVQGLHGGALKVRVAARPVEGAANEALLEFLAMQFDVPVGRCSIVAGETSRDKRVRIEAPPRATAERVLQDWAQTRTSS
jgi:uncharacterized protein (TIGR00251 family)